jgi:RNA polymerase sigma factor (sigma-70 family)
MSDLDLLQDYARAHSQAAFATLVGRHVNLVYSAAHRQVRSPQLAEEVTQSVFLDLARHAPQFRAEQPLAAWLFTVTRRTAIDAVRREVRRQARERTAAEIAAMEAPPSTWAQTKDVLDDAMEALSETERTALLLRFFESRSLREVGEVLGLSEDTAQKRVSRALDRLRDLLLQRGVALSAAGLATDLSAHAVETAPSALMASLSSATFLSTAAALPVASPAVHTATFTVLQKAATFAATAAVLGLAAYETDTWLAQRREADATRTRLVDLRATLQRLDTAQNTTQQRLRAARELLAAQSSLTAGDPAVETAIAAWLKRLERLKQLATGRPDLVIPEMAALTESHWLTAAREAAFDTEAHTREAFGKLHDLARNAVADRLHQALTRHTDTHGGILPASVSDLAPLLKPPLPASLLARYEMQRSGSAHEIPSGEWLIAERLDLARVHDQRLFVTSAASGVDDLSTVSDREFQHAVRAFVAAHAGQLPIEPAQLVPLLRSSPSTSAIQRFLERPTSDFAPVELKKYLLP